MGEFDDLQKTLGHTRSVRDEVSLQLRAARERQQNLERRIAALSRSRRADDSVTDRQIAILNEQVAQQTEHVNRLRSEVDRLAGVEDAAFNDFVSFSDPTANISRLNAAHPIVLFPVRIETRFKTIGTGPTPRTQLWVRVYPDDIAIDTFEEMLADVEARNARAYWIQIWKAGGVDAEKRAAWRALVSSHGAGRAHWILSQFRPLNPADEPVKVNGDHVLVIVAIQPLPAPERVAAAAYWRAVWLANGDATATAAAFASLSLATGQTRAQIIRDQYAPINLSERPSAVTNVKTAFLD